MLPEALTQALEDGLMDAKNPFAVFDFDNTCIVNDVGEATLAYLCDRELLHDRSLLGEGKGDSDYHKLFFHTYHALLGEGKKRAAYMLNARMFCGFTPGEAEAVTLAAILAEGKKIGSKMLYDLHIERGLARNEAVLSLMDRARSRGARIWIVSASPEPCVRAAMQHFGVEAELIGMRSAVRDGAYTSELEEPMSMFEGKAECIRKFISEEQAPLLAAGDTVSDLPMLEMASIKVVVDRDNELSSIAREREWFLL